MGPDNVCRLNKDIERPLLPSGKPLVNYQFTIAVVFLYPFFSRCNFLCKGTYSFIAFPILGAGLCYFPFKGQVIEVCFFPSPPPSYFDC